MNWFCWLSLLNFLIIFIWCGILTSKIDTKQKFEGSIFDTEQMKVKLPNGTKTDIDKDAGIDRYSFSIGGVSYKIRISSNNTATITSSEDFEKEYDIRIDGNQFKLY